MKGKKGELENVEADLISRHFISWFSLWLLSKYLGFNLEQCLYELIRLIKRKPIRFLFY